jgi:hypothetical protein
MRTLEYNEIASFNQIRRDIVYRYLVWARRLLALPLQFDEATNRTIELIHVLWLKGNAIIAAFEIESTTSIYSGLLRIADLVAMQPNLSIPLYLVAPEDRREKVVWEINRPTFARSLRSCLLKRNLDVLKTCLKLLIHAISLGSAYGSRTRVPALRGLCPNH